MMQNGCRIGGEQSGHIIFSKYASTGDGILTSLKMMEVIMARKKKLSELTADLAIYPQVLENVRVHDKAAAQADVDVQAAVERVAEALGDTGRILVRESGTEPLLRVMVEAESEELCRKYVDHDQVGDRCLSCTGRTYKCKLLSRFCIQADILQDHMLFRITKINIFKTDITTKHCQFSIF